MKRILATSAIALSLGLGACANQPAPTAAAPAAPTTAAAAPATPAPTPTLASITTADLQAALADAKAHNDAVAAQCYSGLLPVIPKLQALLTPPNVSGVSGVFSAFQAARDLKSTANSLPAAIQQLRPQINLACGALQMDVQATIADPLGVFSGPGH